MPALQQISGIEFLLLPPHLFLLIGAVLAGAHSFENLTFAVSLVIFAERLLTQLFETAKFGLKLLTKAEQIFAASRGELEFGRRASGGKPRSV